MNRTGQNRAFPEGRDAEFVRVGAATSVPHVDFVAYRPHVWRDAIRCAQAKARNSNVFAGSDDRRTKNELPLSIRDTRWGEAEHFFSKKRCFGAYFGGSRVPGKDGVIPSPHFVVGLLGRLR